MTAPLTMNRVIHAAVRRDLDRLSAALDVLADGDVARAGELARAFAHLRYQLTQHHEGEDRYVWPALATLGVPRDLLSSMETEHGAMSAALAETDGAMAALARTGSAADAEAARLSLARTREVVDRHLDHEELELEPLIQPHLESPEWKAVERQLRRQPPGQTGRLLAWLEDGMGREERSYLSSTIPAPVRLVLGRVFGRSYRREIAPVWRA
jgi:hemerythrin-like domain-containing protein